MTAAEIRARTAARKAAGESQVYPEHAGGAKPVRAALPARLALCDHLGERIPGEPCGSPLRRCNLFGDITSVLKPCAGAQRCCQTCDGYAPPATGKKTDAPSK